MTIPDIDAGKLKQAIREFGSLEKALEQQRHDNKSLRQRRDQLINESESLIRKKGELITNINMTKVKLGHREEELQKLSEIFSIYDRQYDLFQGFLAMLLGSPSVGKSLKDLIILLQKLVDSGWSTTKNADNLRSLFVSTILGDYIKCFHCSVCGASFIVNRDLQRSFLYKYACPACHNWYGTEPDDSFVKTMVSKGQLEKISLASQLDILKEFEAFMGLPCEICGKPITKWIKGNVAAIIKRVGLAHEDCWQSTLGKILMYKRVFDKVADARTKT